MCIDMHKDMCKGVCVRARDSVCACVCVRACMSTLLSVRCGRLNAPITAPPVASRKEVLKVSITVLCARAAALMYARTHATHSMVWHGIGGHGTAGYGTVGPVHTTRHGTARHGTHSTYRTHARPGEAQGCRRGEALGQK